MSCLNFNSTVSCCKKVLLMRSFSIKKIILSLQIWKNYSHEIPMRLNWPITIPYHRIPILWHVNCVYHFSNCWYFYNLKCGRYPAVRFYMRHCLLTVWQLHWLSCHVFGTVCRTRKPLAGYKIYICMDTCSTPPT